MPPGLGTILFVGLGYVLVYAAVANHGRFATHPWAGLLEDAYTGNRSTATGGFEAAPAGPIGPTTATSAPGAGHTGTGRRRNPPRRPPGVLV